LLRSLKEEGITIMVSTPYMDEASLCDRVGLIQKGSIMGVDTPAGLRQSFGNKLLAMKSGNMLSLLRQLQSLPEVEHAYPFGEKHHVVLKPGAAIPSLQSDIEIEEVNPDIEDCFISLMRTHAG